MRITGCALGGASYAFFASYALAPLVGLGFDSASVVSAFAALPSSVVTGVKFGLVFPFVFHAFNGVKQLVYDCVIGYHKRTIQLADYFIWAWSFSLTAYITYWW